MTPNSALQRTTDLLIAQAPRDFALAAALALAAPAQAQQVPENGCLCCNLRTDGSWISVWKFWLWSFSPFTVFFDDKAREAKVTGNEETLAKVYLE